MTALAVRTQLDRARTALAKVETIGEAVNVRAFAESVRYMARQAKAGMDAQNEAAEIRLRAERRAGELLAEAEKHPGAATRLHDVTALPPKLCDLGVSKIQSHRYQQVAEIPERPFERYIAEKKKAGDEITTAELLRKAAPPPARDVAKEARSAIGYRPAPTDRRQKTLYYESFGDSFGVTFHAERVSAAVRRMAAKEQTLADKQRLAALLREAANALDALDAVQRSEAPAE